MGTGTWINSRWATVSADDADDDQRSLQYGDAILSAFFCGSCRASQAVGISFISIGLREVPKRIWGALLSHGKSKKFFLPFLSFL